MRTITCFGSGEGTPGTVMYDAMHEVGKLLAYHGVTVVTGGYLGAGMEAPSKGASEAGGVTRAYTHREDRDPNKYVVEIINCHRMALGMPSFQAEYGIRLCGLLASDGFILASGGSTGTFLELVGFIVFAQKFWPMTSDLKRLAILSPESCRQPGWSDAMLEQLGSWGILKPRERELIKVVASPEKSVAWVLEH